MGAISWLHSADNLVGVQSLAFVSKNFFSLLTAYNASKAATGGVGGSVGNPLMMRGSCARGWSGEFG